MSRRSACSAGRRSSRTSRRCTGCATSSRRAPEWFTSQGRRERKGFRSFSVSGRVKKPGVVLAPAGVTARELIDEYCGGMVDGQTFKGYLPGGASGGILPASMADEPLDFGTLEKYGCFVGSHAVVILSEQGRHEGGGAQPDEVLRGRKLRPVHAVPGRHREGRQADGNRARGTPALLTELSDLMRDASICGLGQAAPNPLLCVLKYFPDELTSRWGVGDESAQHSASSPGLTRRSDALVARMDARSARA